MIRTFDTRFRKTSRGVPGRIGARVRAGDAAIVVKDVRAGPRRWGTSGARAWRRRLRTASGGPRLDLRTFRQLQRSAPLFLRVHRCGSLSARPSACVQRWPRGELTGCRLLASMASGRLRTAGGSCHGVHPCLDLRITSRSQTTTSGPDPRACGASDGFRRPGVPLPLAALSAARGPASLVRCRFAAALPGPPPR